MKEQEFLDKLRKKSKYSDKKLPKLLKYLKLIKDSSEYEVYLKDYIKIPLVKWVLQVLVVRPTVLTVALFCLSAKTTTQTIILAEGISLSWYLLVELKKELWRKEP